MFVFGLTIGFVSGVLATLGLLLWALQFDYGQAFHTAYHPEPAAAEDHRAYDYDPPRSRAEPKDPPLNRPVREVPYAPIGVLPGAEHDLPLEELRKRREAEHLAYSLQEGQKETSRATLRSRGDAYDPEWASRAFVNSVADFRLLKQKVEMARYQELQEQQAAGQVQED